MSIAWEGVCGKDDWRIFCKLRPKTFPIKLLSRFQAVLSCWYYHTRLHLGFSAKIKVYSVPTNKMAPKSLLPHAKNPHIEDYMGCLLGVWCGVSGRWLCFEIVNFCRTEAGLTSKRGRIYIGDIRISLATSYDVVRRRAVLLKNWPTTNSLTHKLTYSPTHKVTYGGRHAG